MEYCYPDDDDDASWRCSTAQSHSLSSPADASHKARVVIGRSGTAMANTEHVERLKQGSTAWNAWRKENVSIVPDLSDADLPGADLRDSDLHGADLSDADLTGANLTGSDLHGADLSDV